METHLPAGFDQAIADLEAKKIPDLLREMWADFEPPENKCRGCGKCCEGEISILIPEAIFLDGKPWVNPGPGCPFLTPKKRCSVHDIRPLVCRAYGPDRGPLGPNIVYAEVLDIICAGVCWQNRTDWVWPNASLRGTELSLPFSVFGFASLSTNGGEFFEFIKRAFRGIFVKENGVAVLKENPGADIDGLADEFKSEMKRRGIGIQEAREAVSKNFDERKKHANAQTQETI